MPTRRAPSHTGTAPAREVLRRGVNVLAQRVALRGGGEEACYSWSCNPDVSLDILPALNVRRAREEGIAVVGQVNRLLPFMPVDAELPARAFDFVLQTPACELSLFAPPRVAVSPADHATGLHIASLIKDGGTLQIGIGSIGDAVAMRRSCAITDPRSSALRWPPSPRRKCSAQDQHVAHLGWRSAGSGPRRSARAPGHAARRDAWQPWK